MAKKGYKTITINDKTLDKLDNLGKIINIKSRNKIIEWLLTVKRRLKNDI